MIPSSLFDLWRKSINAGMIVLSIWSLGWAAASLPSRSSGSDLEVYATRIAAGEQFKVATLRALRPQIQAFDLEAGRPTLLRSIALIEVRLAEIELMDGRSIAKNQQFDRAERAVQRALDANSLDAFLWYASFWLIKLRSGFNDKGLKQLAMSYATGAHEGWIAVHRNGDAVAVLSALPPRLQTLVLDEFRNLVASNYIDDAANIVSGPGWPEHDRLLAGLAGLPQTQLRDFAAALERREVDVKIPDLPKKAKKPWDFAPG